MVLRNVLGISIEVYLDAFKTFKLSTNDDLLDVRDREQNTVALAALEITTAHQVYKINFKFQAEVIKIGFAAAGSASLMLRLQLAKQQHFANQG